MTVRAPRITWPAIIAIWTLPAIADVIDTYVTTAMRGVIPELGRIVLVIAPGWYAWAAMTPAIIWLSRRFPIIVQIGASIAATFIHVSVVWATGRIIDPTEHMVSGRLNYWDTLGNWVPISLLIYWAVTIAGHAYDSMRRASALSAELAQAQLMALRAQLHPHFLFNALNAAVSLVRVGKPEDGVRVLTGLSDILRHMLRESTAHELTLREELKLLRRYLDIEQTRFANGLAIRMTVDEPLLDALVPSLILQPLVENAIRHGVAMREDSTCVAIDAWATGSVLALRVRDDGPGLPSGWDAERCSGVGLRNTRARLAGLYGQAAELALTGGPAGGVDAQVTLPLRFAGE
jgi:two-component system, LytTR family, sensor kinase